VSGRHRVILNDRVLYRPLTGVGHYASQLLRAFSEIGTGELDVQPFLGRYWAAPKPDPVPASGDVGGSVPARRRRETEWLRGLVRRACEPPYEMLFRWRTGRFRLYHEPNHIPIETTLPTVTTIHDISVLSHPEWHPEHRVRWYERQFERGRRQSVRFIAASEFTRRELVERVQIPADQIDVTHQAARPEFYLREPEAVRETCRAMRLPEQFFLFVGTLEPRKNISTLLEAHAELPASIRRSCPLVLVGAWGWKNEALDGVLEARQAAGDIRMLGYVANETLACLYSACTALAWPSLYEGFGLPPLEAMACGAPVIVSNVASLPEVVGEGGVLLDPNHVGPWTEAMRRMVEDSAWREQWGEKGLARAATFSWQRCAAQTLETYRRAIG
jgi:alpha-1,3-rhamnosyl/mannosyltransferase